MQFRKLLFWLSVLDLNFASEGVVLFQDIVLTCLNTSFPVAFPFLRHHANQHVQQQVLGSSALSQQEIRLRHQLNVGTLDR